MWRTLTVSKERLADTLNELEDKGCEIKEMHPEGSFNFIIVFKEPQVLNEIKPS